MRFYATNRVLTQGIVPFEGKLVQPTKKDTYARSNNGMLFLSLGSDAFKTLSEAKTNAVEKARKNCFSKEKALKRARDTLKEFIAIHTR